MRWFLGLMLLMLLAWFVGTAVGIVPMDPSNALRSLPPDKIIEQGRSLDKRLAESTKRKDILPALVVEKKEVDNTRSALKSIEPTAAQYKEAQQLLACLDKREAELSDSPKPGLPS